MDELSDVKKKYIDYINNIIINKKNSHSYLIEVDNYDDDMKYIFLFIKMILCNMSFDKIIHTNNKIVKLVDEGNYPDITIISSDSSVIKKSALIELQKEFNNKSLLNNYKIYIIKEAEKLNASSANTILKFLEEPEDNIIAFLVTDNRFHVLDTIISRCQILSLKESSYDYVFDDEIADFISYLLNPDDFFINYNEIIKSKYSDKNSFKNMLISSEKIILDYISNSNKDYFDVNISNLFSKCSINYLIGIISIIEDYLVKLDFNVNYKLWVDSLFSELIGG